jgi:hypothetical protein|tara:strand:+ start:121 stop:354 length:234 start_codon:yes stop_codon:yes gene_type:complete
MERKLEIIAEQYLEVRSNDSGAWVVNLVIESLPNFITSGEHCLTYQMGEFRTVEESDEFADSLRFLYDKEIFKYELM